MPAAEVNRSDSNRSDTSQKPRVSFNRDVHVKRIVHRDSGRNPGPNSNAESETRPATPVRRQRLKKSQKELADEAAEVLRQVDSVRCVAQKSGSNPEQFYSLPRKKNRDLVKDYPTFSLDRRIKKRSAPIETPPPTKPPRTFQSNTSNKPSIFQIFKKPEKSTSPKGTNLRRSVSDVTSLKSKKFGPTDDAILKVKKRSESDTEDHPMTRSTKKQLSPIIESTYSADYFSVGDSNKEAATVDDQVSENQNKEKGKVTEQLKAYIDEIDEELYRETGVPYTPPPPKTRKEEPQPIIIDVDKAENISTGKKSLFKNSALGKKIKSLTQKKSKSNSTEKTNRSVSKQADVQNRVSEKVKKAPAKNSNSKKNNKALHRTLSAGSVSPNIQSVIEDLQKSAGKSPDMIHSSQVTESPPFYKGRTVNSMVKRLSNGNCSSPPPRPNILITPNVCNQHNANQPFSYTQGMGPEQLQSNQAVRQPNSPIIYAQVVCGDNGLGPEKQTIHTVYKSNRRQPHSDSDEGLGGEEMSGFSKKGDTDISLTHFGDEQYHSYQTDSLFGSLEKESPITPKYRTSPFGFNQHNDDFVNYLDPSSRGRGDGMDSKHKEGLSEHRINELNQKLRFSEDKLVNKRSDLTARRDLLESRFNRKQANERHIRTTPDYLTKSTSPKVTTSETPVKYYTHESKTSLIDKYLPETKAYNYEEGYIREKQKYIVQSNDVDQPFSGLDSDLKSMDSPASDYPSSPENFSLESSHRKNRYLNHKHRLFKDREVHKSTPEINFNSSYPNDSAHQTSYHDSLRKGVKTHSEKYTSERYLNQMHSERRTDKLGDSGIETDIRREGLDQYRPMKSKKVYRDLNNDSEDEGFASSLLIANERQHTEENINPKSKKNYESDRTNSIEDKQDKFYKYLDNMDYKNNYVPRERNVDDGSYYDPVLANSTLKRVEKKPPKPEKKSSLGKVKSLFTSKKKKEKLETTRNDTSRNRHSDYKPKNEPMFSRLRKENKKGSLVNLNENGKHSPPSESLPKESVHNKWFKSLDRLSKRKEEREGYFTSTEDETIISPPNSRLRFFGDTDAESNGDSLRGCRPVLKSRPGLRTQSNRDLRNMPDIDETDADLPYKPNKNHTSPLTRETAVSSPNLKHAVSPRQGNTRTLSRQIEERPRRRKHESNLVESSTEGDSSQSQRSIVYLHAATVGDIPGPGRLKNNRRTTSKEELASNNSSSRIQPQIKTLSRSFSVLAPWKPRHSREALDIDYTQYPNRYENNSSKNSSNREDTSTFRKRNQEDRRNDRMRESRSRENLTSSQTLRSSRDEKGSSSTLYKKKEKLPREYSKYNKDDKKTPSKCTSVESLNRKSKDGKRDISRSVSIPRDTEKRAGWAKKLHKF